MLINFHRSKIRDACCLDLAQLSLASGGGGGGGGSLKWASPQDVTDHQGWKRQKLHEKVLQANKTAFKNYIVARVLRLLATKKITNAWLPCVHDIQCHLGSQRSLVG